MKYRVEHFIPERSSVVFLRDDVLFLQSLQQEQTKKKIFNTLMQQLKTT